MELEINVMTGEPCGFSIKDITNTIDNGYLEESSEEFIKDRFKYSDTISIISLTLKSSDAEESVYGDPIFIEHNLHDYFNIPVGDDGHYELRYIVLPTKEWFDLNKSKYKKPYYSDGIKIYKYIDGQSVEVNILELVEVNTIDTTISRICEDFISICFLKQCFIRFCKKIFDLRGFGKCAYLGSIDEDLIYKRDLVWMAINTISYLTEFGQLDEALRIIELINNCNGICKSEYRKTVDNGCGCS